YGSDNFRRQCGILVIHDEDTLFTDRCHNVSAATKQDVESGRYRFGSISIDSKSISLYSKNSGMVMAS
ncbi:MAG: hypothetical protein V3T19_11005, partial [Acidiferrobacterales bacterium]